MFQSWLLRRRFYAFLSSKNVPCTRHPWKHGPVVGDELDIAWDKFPVLPDDLTCRGRLILRNTPTRTLPRNLTVEGGFFLSHSLVTTVPECLTLGHTFAVNNGALTHLPRGFRVPGDLALVDTPIQVLPEGLWVGGRLVLTGTGVERLPKDLSVGAYIIPPDSLLDIRAFLQHQPSEVVLLRPESGHQRIAQQAMLTGYPDLQRVMALIPSDYQLRLTSAETGPQVHFESLRALHTASMS